ncbi:MAG: uridine kinase [Candidatus Hepatoplasma scabrum]|nr:MAG: uridine kinase [Candidatus Hepatoplasma sp.]
MLKMKQKSKIILISGGTASGKSAISKDLSEIFQKNKIDASFFSIDNYYYDEKEIKNIFKINDLTKVNFDDPNTINWKDFNDDLNKVFSGLIVERKIYNFKTCNYDLSKTFKVKPAEYIIIEGIFAFFNQKLLNNAFKKIYIEADGDLRLIRRYKRDYNYHHHNHSFNCENFINRWEKQIYPMFKKYIEKNRKQADYVILNNIDSKININKKAKQIFDLIKDNN